MPNGVECPRGSARSQGEAGRAGSPVATGTRAELETMEVVHGGARVRPSQLAQGTQGV